MANELSVTSGWSYSKSGRVRSKASTTPRYDVAGNGVIDQVQTIGFATHEALALGDVTTFGFASFKNLDGTNFVEIGIDDGGTFHPFIKLLAGESATVFLTEAPYAKADTAAVDLDYIIVER